MTLNEKNKMKFPDTRYFHYYNANPKGKITGDCVFRALSVVTQTPYEEVMKRLFELSSKYGYSPTSLETYQRFLKEKGFVKVKQPRKSDNTKFTAEEFIDAFYNPVGELNLATFDYELTRVFLHLGSHHVACIVNGQVWDIWNSTEEKVGSVFVKKVN